MKLRFAILAAAALGLMDSGLSPAAAQDAGMSGAEKLRRLDIMLMVTGLRCRTGADNFTEEYGAFTTAHLPALNGASAEMQKGLIAKNGPFGTVRALDRISVTMANKYGQGHPWLSCAQLKSAARVLSTMDGSAQLEMVADQLLAGERPEGFALPGE